MNVQIERQTNAGLRGDIKQLRPRTRKRVIAGCLAVLLIFSAVLTDGTLLHRHQTEEQITATEYLRSIPQQGEDAAIQTLHQLIQTGDYQTALNRIDDFLKMISEASPLYEELLVEQGCLMALVADYDGANSVFSRLNRLYPENAQAWLMAAQLKLLDENMNAAMYNMKKYLSLVPGEENELSVTAQLCFGEGDYAGTLEYGARAIALNQDTKDGDLLRCMGLAALLQGDMGDAESYFSKCILLIENKAEAHYNRGVCRMSQGNLEAAATDFTAAIDAGYASSEAHYNRGVCQMTQGSFEAAATDFTAAIDAGYASSEAHYNRGVCQMSQGNLEAAIADFSAVIDGGNADGTAYYNRGVCRMGLSMAGEAFADFTEALKFDDKDATAYYNRGVCGIELEIWDAVMADMAMVVKLNQDAELTAVAESVLMELNGVLPEMENTAGVVGE